MVPQNYDFRCYLVQQLFQQTQEELALLPLPFTGEREKGVLLPVLSKWVTAAFLFVQSFLRRFAKFRCGSLHILNARSGYGQRRSENTATEQGQRCAWERHGLRCRSPLGRRFAFTGYLLFIGIQAFLWSFITF